MNSQPINMTVAPSGRMRGPVEQALFRIAAQNGLEATDMSFADSAREKGESRRRDIELIRTGKARPEDIQQKNSIVSGPIKVLDWSPLFSA